MTIPGAARTLTMVAAIAVLAGCITSRRSEFSIGEIVTPGNTQVPLPPGQWKLLASESIGYGTVFGGGINNDNSARSFYANIDNGRIVQVVYVSTSAGAPNFYGYGTGANCLRSTANDYVYYSDPRSGAPDAIDCVKVTGSIYYNPPGRGSTALYRRAYESAKAYGGFPRFSVQVEIAQAHSSRFQDYFLSVFPDQSPARTRSGDWTAEHLLPANRAFVDGVIGWAKDFRDAVRLGTEYRL